MTSTGRKMAENRTVIGFSAIEGRMERWNREGCKGGRILSVSLMWWVYICMYFQASYITQHQEWTQCQMCISLSDIKVISMEFYLFNKCTILVRIHRNGNMRVSFDSDTISWLYGREWQSLLLALTLTDLAQVAGHLCFWSGISC